MSIYANIDLEAFKWVKSEVEKTLDQASQELQNCTSNENKDTLFGLLNHLHQIVGTLQMLEFKSLAQLFLENERLADDYQSHDTKISRSSFASLTEKAFATLKESFARIEHGQPENPIDVVELISQIRVQRGLEEVEISSFFSPAIDVFPEVDSQKALRDEVYIKRAVVLRAYYQFFLLNWLRDNDDSSMEKIRTVVDKLLQMSTFGVVTRLCWVTSAYVDYVKLNDVSNKIVHGRIFRQIDDRFRKLELQGESALVSDPGEELIRIMLFYTGVSGKRSPRMDEISDAFNLHEYFPARNIVNDLANLGELQKNLTQLRDNDDLSLQSLRQKVTHYFENEQTDNNGLLAIIEHLEKAKSIAKKINLSIVGDVINASHEVMLGIRKGVVERDEDSGFHMASAIMFVEGSVLYPQDIDQNWKENGDLKLRALLALSSQEQLTPDMDGTRLTTSERQALIAVVGSEVEENLHNVEAKLESFSAKPEQPQLLDGIDQKIRQVRGALQVLGEQKVSLLLKMAEDQFTALQQGKVEANQLLTEALAIAVGTMEEYVKGLQARRDNMGYLLDRSITDLEVAIGKKVTRADVEDLGDDALELLSVDDTVKLDIKDSDDHQNASSARVAAVFEDIQLDDLLVDDSTNHSDASMQFDDELIDLEESLNTFNNDRDSNSETLLKDLSTDDRLVDTAQSQQESLLPDELADIMQHDLLDIDFDGFEAQISNQDDPVKLVETAIETPETQREAGNTDEKSGQEEL